MVAPSTLHAGASQRPGRGRSDRWIETSFGGRKGQGRERSAAISSRVIAGTDCSFATVAGYTMVAEDVVWAKLGTLAAGAPIASRRLRIRRRLVAGASPAPAARRPRTSARAGQAARARTRKAGRLRTYCLLSVAYSTTCAARKAGRNDSRSLNC